MIDPKIAKLTEDELKEENPWASITSEMSWTDLYFPDKELVCPIDREDVAAYNEKFKNNPAKQFRLSVPPDPWGGNVLNSKLLILSLNPGYVDYLNKELAQMLIAQRSEEVMYEKKTMLKLESYSIHKYLPSKIISGMYWVRNLRQLSEDVYGKEDDDKIYEDVAILQYCGYTSESFNGNDVYLKSMDFTRKLILWILANRPNTLILAIRNKNGWKEHIGADVWEDYEGSRIILSKNYRSQAITPANIGELQYQTILQHLIRLKDEGHQNHSW